MPIQISAGNQIKRLLPPTAYVLNNANPTGTTYLLGDNTTEGSVRQYYDGTFYRLQKLIFGVWTDFHTANEHGTTILKSVKTGVASYHLGDVHSMSSAGENVIWQNTASNITWFPVWQGVSNNGATIVPPSSRNYISGTVSIPNGIVSGVGSVSTFTTTVAENHSIYTITIVPAETWSGNVTFFSFYMSNINIISFDIAVSFVADLPYVVVLPYPLDLRTGNIVTSYIQKQDGSNTNVMLRPITTDLTVPYYNLSLKAFEDEPVASASDLVDKANSGSPKIYQNTGAPYIASFGTELYADWEISRAVTITNPASNGALTNYPVNIILNTLYEVSDGDMQSAGQDIRFVDSTGLVPVQYYIQGGLNTLTTSLWVKIPSLPTGNTTIFLLYGNPAAVDAQGPPLTTGGAPIQPTTSVGSEQVWVAPNITNNVTITTTGVQANGSQLVAYKGTWNANTNTPTIPTASNGNQGNYYVVSVAGTTTIGANSDWDIGDILVSNGTTWDRIPQQITVITDSVDFNTMTAAGMWASDQAPSANYPDATTPATWRLWVVISGSLTYQWLYSSHGTFLRHYNGSVWTGWIQTDRDTPLTIIQPPASPATAVPGLNLVNPSTGTGSITLPTITALLDGKIFKVKKIDTTNSTTVTVTGPIDGGTSLAWHIPYQAYTLCADFTNNSYWIV